MPTVLSPTQWGAKINYDSWNDPYTPDDGVALHHGGGGDYPAHHPPYSRDKEEKLLCSWEQHHLNKGWRGLAYGWGVGQTGLIYRIRGWNTYGAHTGDADGDGIANNSEIVPIIFVGSGNWVHLSPAAKDSIAWLRREVIQVKAPLARVLYGHQEVSPLTGTTCPGPKLMEYVNANRVLLEDMALTTDEINQIAQAVWAHPSLTTSGGVPISALKQIKWIYDNSVLAANDTLSAAEITAIVDQIEEAGIAQAIVDGLAGREIRTTIT